MARSSSRTYDPKTGTWTKSATTTKDTKDTKTKTTEPKSSDKENLTSTTSDSSSSKGKSEKKYNEIEYNTLELSVNFVANDKTIVIGAGDTITIKGIGKYLSGKYYVQDVTHSISTTGYSISATCIKTDFGNSIKTTEKDKTAKKETKKVESTAKDSKDTSKTHVLQKGETLWSLAVKFYKDGSKYEKIAKANGISEKEFNKLPIGKKIIIP